MADYKIKGDKMQDKRHRTTAYIKGDKILDERRRTMAYIKGDKILDERRRPVAKMRDIDRAIDGPGGASKIALWLLFVK